MIFIYFGVILVATTIGAVAGLGGGVIIKPLLDAIGYHNASAIGFYSSVAVLAMSIVSIIKQIRKGFQIQVSTVVYISLGSCIGGFIGDILFKNITVFFEKNIVKAIQAILLLVTLISILLYTLNQKKIKTYNLTNPLLIIFIGLFLGAISVFLGIGGGPLNVSLLILLFSFDIKQSTVYSIVTILFSQLFKLVSVVVSKELLSYDLSFIPFICVSAILGGYIGTLINQRLINEKIEKVYTILILGLICLSIYNIFVNLS